MNKQEIMIKEYEELRCEIEQKIGIQNSLIMFMITAVIAVLAFAVEGNNSILYLLPFGIIIPTSMRITYYRTAMARISAYIVVYIEKNIKGLNWETRIHKFVYKGHDTFRDNITISQYYEGMILSLMCYLLYFFDFIKGKTVCLSVIIYSVLPILFVIWEMIITRRIAGFTKERDFWINQWEVFKNNNQ
jgi:hypothetical protein